LSFTCFFILAVLISTATLYADMTTHDFLRDLSSKRKEFSVVKANLKIENITPEQTTESHGSLTYVRPNRLVFRIFSGSTTEQTQVFLVDKSRLFEYDSSIQQMQIYDLSDNIDIQALLFAFENDLTKLEEHYRVSLFEPGDAADRATQGLMLEPKEDAQHDTRLFERIRIYFREKDLLPTLIHVINDADSEAIMYLNDIQVVDTIVEHEDQIAAPKGTTIIENDQKVRTVSDEIEYIPDPVSPLATTSVQKTS